MRHYLLNEDRKTPREVSVEEWRKDFSKYSSGWADEIDGIGVYTSFLGMQSPNFEPIFWNTSVYPKGCRLHQAIVHEESWRTCEEAELGHKSIVEKIKSKEWDFSKKEYNGLRDYI